ncbi:uncharacterized protein LOC128043005 [Gossypium raimondii]|uniref:uncharacterized protein LOC128043005 n=1 Tax=Gossypium raimondii TaxID=29730 RepID=UPI00227A4A57|nr:uncharacterized protein LOC128043005 [Gossypium raimondii]
MEEIDEYYWNERVVDHGQDQAKGVLGHVDEAVSDLFDGLGKGVTPVPAILAETFRSLNAYRRASEGRFIGCAQLLIAWFHSHFWKVDKVLYRVFSGHYSPLKEIVATPRRDDISEENWIAILQNLQEDDVEWRAPWLIPDGILYRCGSFDWVPLLGIWGAVGYAPLLVLRQYNLRQFVSATYGLAQCEFSYRGDNYKKKVKEISQAWNQVHRMKRLAVGSMTTPEYGEWRRKRINDNIPELNLESVRPMEGAIAQIPEVADYLQTMAIQADVLSVKYELELNRGQELASLLKEESQNDLMTKLTQLLTKGVDKGQGPVIINEEENNDEPLYPPGFTLCMRKFRLSCIREDLLF